MTMVLMHVHFQW